MKTTRQLVTGIMAWAADAKIRAGDLRIEADHVHLLHNKPGRWKTPDQKRDEAIVLDELAEKASVIAIELSKQL
jgi:hypothetical protein